MYIAEIGSSGAELSRNPPPLPPFPAGVISDILTVCILVEQLLPVLPTATLSMP